MKVSSRYSEVNDKSRNEEIVLLQGTGCFWKQCTFCDYYLDTSSINEIIKLNEKVLSQITGKAKWLTVINSGSFFELPKVTRDHIIKTIKNKNITDLTIESHYKFRDQVLALREKLKEEGINLHSRIGIETFDTDFRENILNKGMGSPTIEELKNSFDECCLLYGVYGQSREQLLKDIEIATQNFDHVYLNIYEQRTDLKKDQKLINEFIKQDYQELNKIPNLTILLNVEDLGVG